VTVGLILPLATFLLWASQALEPKLLATEKSVLSVVNLMSLAGKRTDGPILF
jgi:hypothetical protein